MGPDPSHSFPTLYTSKNERKMTSIDFAAAQARVLERRRQRELEARNRLPDRTAQLAPVASKLPYPLSVLPNKGLYLWDTIKGREGTRPAFRVGQVDAELLDEELLGLLKGQVGEGLKYFGVSCGPTCLLSMLA